MSAGDLMIMFLVWNPSGTTFTSPSGWTQIGTDVVNGTTVAVRALQRTATSGDVTGATYTFSQTAAGNKAVTAIVAYPGGTGIGVVTTNTDGSGTSHIAPADTGLHSGSTSWVLNAWGERSSTNTSWSLAGTSDTQRLVQLGTGGGATSLAIGDSNAGETTWAAQTAVAGLASVGAMMSIEILATSGVVAPGTPTGVSATPGDGSAVVTFTPGSTGGASVVNYTVTSSPGGLTATSTGPPITVAGLTNGTAYTFSVVASNTAGSSTASSSSSAVTPVASAVPFIGWGIRLGAGVAPTPPPTTGTLVGIAPPAQSQAAWDTTGGFAGLTVMRYYSTGMPTSWSTSAGNTPKGPTQWVASVKPNIASTIAGSQDATITTWAKSVPAGTYVTAQHEPEQKAKNITPTQFGQFFARFYSVVKAANPALLIGPIVMTYTSNVRPVDTVGHATAGHNEWLEAVAANNVPVDWCGYDGYQGDQQGTNISDIFGPPTILAQGLFGVDIPFVAAEWGYHTSGAPDATVNAWMINGYQWFNSNNYVIATYWDGTDFTLDNAELTVLGGLS